MKRTPTQIPVTPVLYLIALLLVLPVTSVSQEQAPPDQAQQHIKRFASRGCFEVGGSMGFMVSQIVTGGNTSDAIITFSATPYAGYFLIDGLELGVNPLGVTITRTPAIGQTPSITSTSLALFFAPSYNFRLQGMLVPFVEGLAGYTADITAPSGGNTTTVGGFSWGGRGGVKLAIVERGLLVLGAQYIAVTKTPSGQSNRSGSNEFAVTAGFTVWF